MTVTHRRGGQAVAVLCAGRWVFRGALVPTGWWLVADLQHLERFVLSPEEFDAQYTKPKYSELTFQSEDGFLCRCEACAERERVEHVKNVLFEGAMRAVLPLAAPRQQKRARYLKKRAEKRAKASGLTAGV